MANEKSPRRRLISAKKTPAPPERPPEPAPESDESEWAKEWDGSVVRRTLSFYHAEGAPYLDDDGKLYGQPPAEEVEELEREGLVVPPALVKEIVGSVVPVREVKKTPAPVPVKAARSHFWRSRTPPEEPEWRGPGPGSGSVQGLPRPRLKKPIDLSIVEQVAYFVMKKVFRDGVKIPIRREGVADLDVIIKDKEVVIDVNQLFFDTPKLSVWRITVAYQGEALAVFGRGVKGDLKINPFNMARFLARAWLDKRKYDKQLKRETTG